MLAQLQLPPPARPPDPWAVALAYLPLVTRVAREYRHGEWDTDDLIQEGLIGVRNAALRYDPARGSFFRLVDVAVHNRMRDWLRWRHRDRRATGDVTAARSRDVPWDVDDLIDALAAFASLTELQRSAIAGQLGLHGPARSESQIGVALGMTRDAVARLRIRGLARLRKRLTCAVRRPVARRPCVICGDPDGVIPQGRRTPERLSLARFGRLGTACRTCWLRLYAKQRAARPPGPDTRRLPPGRERLGVAS